MRFSLMILLLLALWAGAGMAIWFYREPWVFERFESKPVPEYGDIVAMDVNSRMPDGRRDIGPFAELAPRTNIESSPFVDVVFDRKANEVLYRFQNVQMNHYTLVLRSDDAFEVCVWVFKSNAIAPDTYGLAHFRRRFPEWWWGHFYRPEVWVFALTTIVLLVRGVQALRRRRLARAV